MDAGAFLLGLVTFSILGIVIRGVVLWQRAEAKMITVPDGVVVILESGIVMARGDRYSPAELRKEIHLGTRLIEAKLEPGMHGINDHLFMQLTYVPDTARIPQHAQAIRSAGSDKEFARQLAQACAGRLSMSRDPDFSDLDFADIEDAFGIRIRRQHAKPRPAIEREKERVSASERYIRQEAAKFATRKEMIYFLAEREAEARKEPNLVIQNYLLQVITDIRQRIQLAD